MADKELAPWETAPPQASPSNETAPWETAPPSDPNKLSGQALIDFMRSGKDQSARGQTTLSTGRTGVGQTAAEHFGNNIAMNYIPQLQGAAEPVTNAIGNLVTGQKLAPTPYLDVRDQAIKRMQDQATENPGVAAGAGVAGGIVGGIATPIPGMGAAKGVIGATAKAAGSGALQGLLQNPGDTEGKIDPVQFDARKENAKTGALIGGTTGLGTSLAAKGLGVLARSPETLKTVANDSAVNASGAMLKDFRQMEGNDRAQKLGQYLRDNKIVQAGDTFEDVAKKAGDARTAAGKDLDSLYKKAVAKFGEGPGETPLFNNGFSPERDKEAILAQVSKGMGNQEGKQSALDRLGKYLDQLAKDHALTDSDGKIIPGGKVLDPRTTQDVKTEMDKAINYARNPLTKEPAAESAFKEARDIISKKIDAEISRLGSPEDVKALKAANESYGFAKQAENMAADKVNRISANNRMGLTDTIAGGAGLAAGATAGALADSGNGHGAGGGALAGGLLAAGANHYGKKYGSAGLAGAAGGLSPLMRGSGVPYAAGKAGLLLQNPGLMGRLAVENKLKDKQP